MSIIYSVYMVSHKIHQLGYSAMIHTAVRTATCTKKQNYIQMKRHSIWSKRSLSASQSDGYL